MKKNKKLVIKLSIDKDLNQFDIEDNFKDLALAEMNTCIGFFTQLIHNYIHIAGEKQGQEVFKRNKMN